MSSLGAVLAVISVAVTIATTCITVEQQNEAKAEAKNSANLQKRREVEAAKYKIRNAAIVAGQQTLEASTAKEKMVGMKKTAAKKQVANNYYSDVRTTKFNGQPTIG